MTIPTQCGCGKSFQVKPELAGRKVRCPACKGVLVVPAVPFGEELDGDALQFLLTEESPRAGTRPRAWEQPGQPELPRPPAPKTPAPLAKPQLPKAKPKRERPRREDGGGRRFRIVISPTIISGVLMMIGAVVWFGLGLVLLNVIFIYPPILFVLGLIATGKGLMGYEDD